MLSFMTVEQTEALIVAVMPKCHEPAEWAAALAPAMHRFGISNDKSFVAAFIAQLALESGQLNRVVENLDYSATRLLEVWPKRFPTIAIANEYAHQPRKLANYVYGGRLGNFGLDAGWTYRGRGPIQVTGLDNYRRLESVLGIPFASHPELLEQKAPGALASAWFWWAHRLSGFAADTPYDDDEADFVTITRKINGGVHGLAQRREYWALAKKHLEI